MGMSTGGSSGAMADINVTPLVDVMLVLLIIFMITAPMLNTGVNIDLPDQTAEPLPQPDADNSLILRIDSEGKFYIKDTEVTPLELLPRLKAIGKANPDTNVFLEADGQRPYSEIAMVLAASKRAGLARVGLVFDPGEEEPSP